MEALGRLLNVVPTARNVEVSVKDCSGVTFVVIANGTEIFTLAEAEDAAATGVQTLEVIDHFYHTTSAAGAAEWTEVDALSAGEPVGVVTPAAGVAVIHVDAKSLSDGYAYVRCVGDGTGLVTAIQHDLNIQRDAPELVAPAL